MLILQNGFVAVLTFSFLFTHYDSFCDGFHVLEALHNNNSVISRVRRQSPCSTFEFRCDNGNCISQYNICDGVADCTDASDEDLRCLAQRCEAFRCAYGACVDGDAACNGVKDCHDNSDEQGCTTSTTNNCGDNFACNNGECIDRYLRCDGAKDCTDGSDETFQACNSISCQSYAYRCAYGACVDGDAKCNGIEECADGSDESPKICPQATTPTPPVSTPGPNVQGCVLPPQIRDGFYKVISNFAVTPFVPGQVVNDYTVIQFECNSNYALYPANPLVICISGNGGWDKPLPQCLRTCPPRVAQTIDITCELGNDVVDCTKPMVHGTIATMKCKHLYTQVNWGNPVAQCKDGSWDLTYINCDPDCGKLIPKGSTFIIEGEDAIQAEFPWHVGVYKLGKPPSTDYNYICGGSLISTNVVASAAHCFTERTKGVKHDASLFSIAAGKYYRDYDAPQDEQVQKRLVKDMFIPKSYRGLAGTFSGDIALIILDTPFQLTNVIQPVCIDWHKDLEAEALTPSSSGTVVGWGFTKIGKDPAKTLRKLTVPYIDYNQCLDTIPDEFIRFVTLDKFCAGYLNGSSVCNGDSGGGLVFYKEERKRYYIHGLVSAGPTTDKGCDSNYYGVYTKISPYINDITQVERNNRVI